MLINDTTYYHRHEKPDHLFFETTFGLTATINHDKLASNNSYGVQLAHVLGAALTHKKKIHVLETGPGNGMISFDFLHELAAMGYNITYTAVELSPALAKSSYLHLLKDYRIDMHYLHADAHHLDTLFKPECFDVIISNEMIGDLTTMVNVDVSDKKKYMRPDEKNYIGMLNSFIEDYILDTSIPARSYNLGAFQLIKQASTLLKEEGILFVSEHSCEQPKPGYQHTLQGPHPTIVAPANNPTPIYLVAGEDIHTEYTIKFSDLQHIAQKEYAQVQQGRLVDLMQYGGHSLPSDMLKMLVPSLDKLEHLTTKVSGYLQIPKTQKGLLLLYLKEHPEVLQEELGKDMSSFMFNSKDFWGGFEYLLCKK